MVYTKTGPFINASPTGPYLDAGFFNNVEAALVGTAGVAAAANVVTGWFHIDQFGAVGDGTTIDRPAIQAAVNAANAAYLATGAVQRVYVPAKTYLVNAVDYLKVNGSINGAVSVMLLDGVRLAGPGTIKVKNGAYGTGAFYAVIRSTSSGISHASVEELTIDGNKDNQTASSQCSNIVIEALTNVRVANTRQINVNGNGIMVRGSTSQVATNIAILDNTVVNCTAIGIQASQFTGLRISRNYVTDTSDNGIDIYGENGTTTSNGVNFVIENNILKNNLVGIFPETVAQGVVVGNNITTSASAGIHINRINGQPRDITVADNVITASPVGVHVTGDTGGVTIRDNAISGFSGAGIKLGDGGGGNCSYVQVDGNTLNGTSGAVPLVLFAGNVISFCRVKGTLTSAVSRTNDIVYQTPSSVGNVVDPNFSNEILGTAAPASGAAFTITAPANAGGTLTIRGLAGGAWASVWTGTWVSDGTRVSVKLTTTDFTTPGQLFTSVTGSTTALTITVQTAASGSTGDVSYLLKRV